MKSIIKNKKLYTLIPIFLFLFFNALSLTSVMAIPMHDEAATFDLDSEDPLAYGVFIPEPNMYATLSILGSNQGEFILMDLEGAEQSSLVVDQPGEDISTIYPQYFDDYPLSTTNCIETVTINDYIDPIRDIYWLNVSAYNAESANLSSYKINTAYNYFVMNEGGELQIPLNHSIPMQIDITIDSTGPKILKYDWLTDDPAKITENHDLVSPSGKTIISFPWSAVYTPTTPDVEVFDYIMFLAPEKGTYRLLINAKHDEGKPAYLNLEFLSSSISSLPVESLEFCGNSEDILAIEESEHSTWQSNWLRINGKKGDIFRVDLNKDYATGYEPIIFIWIPTKMGYFPSHIAISEGSYDIFFPINGYAYLSFVDTYYGDWYRYSLFLNKYETLDYNIGANLTSVRLSQDQRKAIEFSLEEDSFIQFNFTSTPPGNPYLSDIGLEWMWPDYTFLFMDSKSPIGFNMASPLDQKVVNDELFCYYYMPAGNYKGMIKNFNTTVDGVCKISSKFIDLHNETIPMNSYTYPDRYPSQFVNIEFEPDDYCSDLHKAQYININITEPGQYFINATIYASENAGAALTPSPSAVVYYNGTQGEWYDNSSMAITPGQTFPVFDSTNDYLYIAYDRKFGGITFDFSQGGDAGGDIWPYLEVWNGFNFNSYVDSDVDGTNRFQQDGLWSFDIFDPQFTNWQKGTDLFDLPDIEEDMYYWARFDCWGSAFTTLPTIDLITLSNITLGGDINLVLVGDSEYEYCDFFTPDIVPELTDLEINPGGIFNDSDAGLVFSNTFPGIIGLEEGEYKLLIIPVDWSYSGPLSLNFALENYWSYRHQEIYNITALTPNPQLHSFQINNYTSYGYANGTGPFYDYGLTTQYNGTEAFVPKLAGNSYFLLECYGEANQWTQLVVSTNNVSSYHLYLMQDLPWVDCSPNSEVYDLEGGFVNSTHEFGVHSNHFYLLFEVDYFGGPGGEMVTFRIALSQYDTVELLGTAPTASYKAPLDTSLIFILAITIPAAIGVTVLVVYITKKKRGGKI
ncbi:MAG: hypothetical protein ACFFCE_18795 [Promethearchaeota archaeon]